MWPRDNPLQMHLCTDDALKLLNEARPASAILTHFGWRMLNADPAAEVEYLQEETGIPVIAAVDGMKATLGDQLVIKGPRKRDDTLRLDV